MAAKNQTIETDTESRSISKTVIIQCPSCQTKFAVSSETISEFDMPRFHCSRCDHLFDMDPATTLSVDMPRKEIGTASLPEESEKVSKPEEEQTYFKYEETERENKSANSQIKSSEPSRSLVIPKDFDYSQSHDAPHEKITASDKEQITFDFTESDRKENDMPYGYSFGAASAERNSTDSPEYISKVDDKSDFQISYDSMRAGIAMPDPVLSTRSASVWSGFWVIATPILVVVALLAGLALYLANTPSVTEKFAHTLSNSQLRLPPPGLRVENIAFQRVILDSGEIVFTVSGKVKNDSSEKFGEIMLEALAFDSTGKTIASNKVEVGSSLANTRMKSLPVDMLKNLQIGKQSKTRGMGSGKSQDFTIALFNDTPGQTDLNKAAFFSARIYSVRS